MNMAFYYHTLPPVDDMLRSWVNGASIEKIIPDWKESSIDFFVVIGVSDDEIRNFYTKVRQRTNEIVAKIKCYLSEHGKEPQCDMILKRLYRFDKVSTANQFLSYLASIPEKDDEECYNDTIHDQIEFWNPDCCEPWLFVQELNAKDLKGLNMFKANTENSILEEMLKEKRVVFPLTDFSGNVTGFAGRNLSISPKYRISGYGFFGNCNTEQNTIIMAEGVTHVLTAESKGYDNVIGFVGIKGERIIDENIEKLRMSEKKVIVFSDSDNYGLHLAERIVNLLKSKQIKAAVYKTDMALDLNDFLLKGHSIEEIIASVKFD
jgi:hypothetical protein